jgi:hypothetical protein
MERTFSGEREAIFKVYMRAIQNWQEINPSLNPMKGIPDEMGMARSSFYRKLRTGFNDDEQLNFFRVCLYPQAYFQLAELVRVSIKGKHDGNVRDADPTE